MLDAYVIEEIKRRERERLREERDRPTLEVPNSGGDGDPRKSERDERPGSTVVTIDLCAV